MVEIGGHPESDIQEIKGQPGAQSMRIHAAQGGVM